MRFLVSHVDPFNRFIGGIAEQVELLSTLLLVTSLKLIREEFVQPQHTFITDHYISESGDTRVNSIGYSNLVVVVLDEVAEILCEQRCQPVIEAAEGIDLTAVVL